MIREDLSKGKLDAGQECLDLLDEFGLGVQGAVWIFPEPLEEWRYYIVTSLVDIDGLIETHNRIAKLFRLRFSNIELTIEDVHLGSPDEELFATVASMLRVSGRSLVQLRDVRFNKLLIEHAYVYRLDRAPPVINAKQARTQFDRRVKQLEQAG